MDERRSGLARQSHPKSTMAHLCMIESALHFQHMLAVGLAGGLIKILGGMMTERMQNYRDRMSEKGLVQVRVWVEKQDEEFVKYLAKFCREVRETKSQKRYGRRATERQIRFAQNLAKSKNVPEPQHLYDHHISLAAWTWRHGSGR